ncbi:MAG: halocyanin domain-containing protein [Haloarculaceae archaeon]
MSTKQRADGRGSDQGPQESEASPAGTRAQAVTLGRRGVLRAGVAAGAVAAAGGPVTAQESPYGGWFDDTDNYAGTVDGTGRESVTVAVGAGETGLVFEPAAIAVDPETTVVWEWTGSGGGHNVVAENGAFESDTVSEAGHTFEHTFADDADGDIVRYVCEPHRTLGMVGAVAVGGAVTPDASADSGPATGGDANDGDGTTTGTADGGGGAAGPATGFSAGDGLAVVGGTLAVALLSPALFALLLRWIYEDDRQPEPPTPPR